MVVVKTGKWHAATAIDLERSGALACGLKHDYKDILCSGCGLAVGSNSRQARLHKARNGDLI